eukprot:SAG31_NODE_8944_length_1359_cov_0.843651_1_plen_162_part_00
MSGKHGTHFDPVALREISNSGTSDLCHWCRGVVETYRCQQEVRRLYLVRAALATSRTAAAAKAALASFTNPLGTPQRAAPYDAYLFNAASNSSWNRHETHGSYADKASVKRREDCRGFIQHAVTKRDQLHLQVLEVRAVLLSRFCAHCSRNTGLSSRDVTH